MNPSWKNVLGCCSRVRLACAAVVAASAVLAMPASHAGTVTYTYDAQGRLVSRATSSAAGDVVTVSITYDDANNRTSVVTTTVDPTPPSVPTGLTATVISATQINLSWSASTDAGSSGVAGYKVRRNGGLIVSTAATTYSDTTVVGSTTYQYTVSAYDGQGNESAPSSPPVNASTPDITAPSVPTGLTGNAVSPNWVNLSWNVSTDTGGSGLSGYEIYRNGSLLNTSITNSYADHSVAASTQYTYAVKAYDGAGNRSGLSSSFVITTPNLPDTTPPSVPTGLGASSPASGTVNLSWAASSDTGPGATGVAGYQVYRGGGYLGSSAATSLTDNTTACGTSYSYQVLAYDGASNLSALSSAVGVTTPDTISPSTPTGLSANAPASNQVNLSWSASSDVCSGVAGYRIYRGGSFLGSSTTTSYTDTTTAANTSYSYQVLAYDGPNNASGLSSAAGVTTPDTIPPGAPGNPTFSAITGSSATANWTAASDNVGVTGYRYSLNGGASWTTLGNVLTTNLSGLSLATSYTMLVQARDAAGYWGASGSGSFSTSSFGSDNMAFAGGTTGDGATYMLQGYRTGLGALTPNTTFNGKTITTFTGYTDLTFGGHQASLVISGFSANPGAGWLQSISVPSLGLTLTGASASFFYGSGTCTWLWPSWSGNFGGSGTLTITHQ